MFVIKDSESGRLINRYLFSNKEQAEKYVKIHTAPNSYLRKRAEGIYSGKRNKNAVKSLKVWERVKIFKVKLIEV